MTEKAGNRRRLLIAAAIVLASLLAAAAVFGLRHKERMAQLESMSFRDMLRYTAEGGTISASPSGPSGTGKPNTPSTEETGKSCRTRSMNMRSVP